MTSSHWELKSAHFPGQKNLLVAKDSFELLDSPFAHFISENKVAVSFLRGFGALSGALAYLLQDRIQEGRMEGERGAGGNR